MAVEGSVFDIFAHYLAAEVEKRGVQKLIKGSQVTDKIAKCFGIFGHVGEVVEKRIGVSNGLMRQRVISFSNLISLSIFLSKAFNITFFKAKACVERNDRPTVAAEIFAFGHQRIKQDFRGIDRRAGIDIQKLVIKIVKFLLKLLLPVSDLFVTAEAFGNKPGAHLVILYLVSIIKCYVAVSALQFGACQKRNIAVIIGITYVKLMKIKARSVKIVLILLALAEKEAVTRTAVKKISVIGKFLKSFLRNEQGHIFTVTSHLLPSVLKLRAAVGAEKVVKTYPQHL